MLNFFRKYQKFFFIIITTVIIISFSFFGTYGTIEKGGSSRDQVVFTAVDGSSVSRFDLDQMALFLGTDSEDKVFFSGTWGPNFLNDGLIKKDILEAGVANLLAEQYKAEIKSDLQTRLDKEKRYTYYTHPNAKFITAESAWNNFAPELKNQYRLLKAAQTADDPAAFAARVNLYLSEKKFPPSLLRQVIRHQEKQYGWLQPDDTLPQKDLSLFGYHTLEDWFGPKFIKVVSQFIINAAKIAERKGYTVSNEEALVSLMNNARMSFQQNQSSPYLGVANPQQYLSEQLRIMGMDQAQAVKIWKQVLLARRMFQDVHHSVFVDPFEFKKLEEYATETVEGEIYKLQAPLQFASYRDMQKFEIYLDSVTKDRDVLLLPANFLSVNDVEKQAPQLIQKRYLLEISEFQKKNLQGKVGIRETWNWEGEEKNWALLKAQFPELGIKPGSTREERMSTLDALDEKTRAKIDAFARNAIVDTHPEWLKDALAQAKPQKSVVALRVKGGMPPVIGLENSSDLMALLDDPKAAEKLALYTADKDHYYSIKVLERNPNKEVLTFEEANSDGTLDKLLNKKLEADYLSIREGRALEFKKADKSWKELSEVQDLVADHYFEKLNKAIKEDYTKNQGPDAKPLFNGDFYATHRLYKQVRESKEKIQKGTEQAITQEEKEENLAQRADLKDQWKLEKEHYHLTRSEAKPHDLINVRDAFNLAAGEWTKANVSQGNIAFFQLNQKRKEVNPLLLAHKVEEVQELLGYEAEQLLVKDVLHEISDKKAISLEYLN